MCGSSVQKNSESIRTIKNSEPEIITLIFVHLGFDQFNKQPYINIAAHKNHKRRCMINTEVEMVRLSRDESGWS